jgi:hypothetical protein
LYAITNKKGSREENYERSNGAFFGHSCLGHSTHGWEQRREARSPANRQGRDFRSGDWGRWIANDDLKTSNTDDQQTE